MREGQIDNVLNCLFLLLLISFAALSLAAAVAAAAAAAAERGEIFHFLSTETPNNSVQNIHFIRWQISYIYTK